MHYLLFTFATLFISALSTCAEKTDADISPNTETEVVMKPETKKGTYPVDEYTNKQGLEKYATAIFAGGCFWCTEAAFHRIEGVVDVISGYSGGEKKSPSYNEVGAGLTNHAEAIYIYYDQEIINYESLLKVLMVAHDPTTLNYQGPDHGKQYRSAIFYRTDAEKVLIDKVIKETNDSGMYKNPVVTEVSKYDEFWVAEDYHQNFYELNPNQGYVRSVSRPKVKKVLKAFPELVKKEYKY